MKNIAKSIRTTLALLLVCALSVGMVACGPETTNTQVAIDLSASAYSISGGVSDESITFVVSVTNSENKEYTLTADHEELVKLEDNKLTVIADTTKNVNVTVTATSKADESVKASKTVTVIANVSEAAPDVKISVNTVNPETGNKKVTLRPNENIKLEIEVTNSASDDNGYTVAVENPGFAKDLVTYNEANGYITTDGTYTAVADDGTESEATLTTNTDVAITVTSTANTAVKESVTVRVKPTTADGEVGSLTTAMLREIANQNITVSGSFTDVYGATKTTYDYKIKMTQTEDADGNVTAGAWYGEWNKQGSKNVQSVNYKLGANDYLNEVYVNKNNVATTKVVKDSDSNPLLWSKQHYWNHLEDIANNYKKFVYDDEIGAYRYDAEYGRYELNLNTWTNVYIPSSDDYLLKYISWSMNPAIEEQFYDFYVYLNADETAIEKIVGITYPNPIYATDSDGNATETITGYYYTTATMNFSDIGTTVVEDPSPYVIDTTQEHYQKLVAAIENAKSMTNYSFATVETSMYSPSLNPDDYDISGSTGDTGSTSGSTSGQGVYDGKIKPYYYRSTTGTIGYLGVVTSDAILINKTMKYDYSMDDYIYRTDPYGYKQNDDGTYDVFEYSFDNKALKGKKKKTGNISLLVPDFDVSPAIFKLSSMSVVEGSEDEFVYTFALRDSAIVGDVAKALCLSDFARYAVGSTGTSFTITVNESGNITNVKFAYDIQGIYGGAYETVYTNVGTSALPEGTFDKYEARVIPQVWSDYASAQTYVADGKYDDGTTKFKEVYLNGAAVIEGLFGSERAANVPAPGVFAKIFDDNLYGPWGDYTRVGTDADGNEKIRYTLKLTAASDKVDENSKITDLEEKIDEITLALNKLGFKIDAGNSYGVAHSNTYVVAFESEELGLQIKIENNNGATFWITIYNYGDYKANK